MDNNQYNENRYNRNLQWYRFKFGFQQMIAHPIVNILWLIFAAGVVFLVWGKKQFVSGINAPSIIAPVFQWCMTAMVIIFPVICAIGLCQFIGYMFAKNDEADMCLVFGSKRDIKNQPPILIYKKKDGKSGVTKREFYTSIPMERWKENKDASIYDLDSMIDERLSFITDETAVSILNEEFSDFVIYPYDYNWHYHMNRIFLPIFALKADLTKKTLMRFLPKYYDGMIAFVLDKKFEISDYLNEENLPDRAILVINQNEEEILYEVKRYVAIKYYYSIRDELKKDDPTVEKELELYLNEQKSVLRDVIASWRNIETDGIAVVSKGQEYVARSDKDISEIASTIMMNSFPRTIIVNNDLVNKNSVSGAIRLARSKALSYIMNNKDNMLKNCSLLSPEHSIIRSVLSKNGLFDGEDNIGVLNTLPNGKIAGHYVSKEIDKYIRKCTNGQTSIKELYDVLKKTPYGLRDGYISVLLAYELRDHENISIYFHGSEHDYCEEELLKALESPEDYSLYICNWSETETAYIESLEKIFAHYIDKMAKNRLKELYEAMNKHFFAISKAARTTNKYVSEKAKLYREIMSITHKDYNKFFFETLLQLDDDLSELQMIIQKIVLELESVTKLQIQTIEKVVRTVLEIEPDVSITAELNRLYQAEWKEKRFKSFDYQTSMMLDYLANMNLATGDEEIVQELGRVVTGFEIEYWNDSKIEDFYEAFSKMV